MTICLYLSQINELYFFLNSWGGMRLNFLGTAATNWPTVLAPDVRWCNDNWQGKPKYSEKICPIATFYTTNPTWPDLELNQGRQLTAWAMARFNDHWFHSSDTRFCGCWESFRSYSAVNQTLASCFTDSRYSRTSWLLGMNALCLLWRCRNLCYSLLHSVVALGQMVQKVCFLSLKNKRAVNNVCTTCVYTIVDLDTSDSEMFVNIEWFAGEARRAKFSWFRVCWL
jgi:hypothetical protein